ncbi:hypothetical protein AMECASPLE_029916 [Ameca splendens]|uniref:Uncharacterized protein n=1 Tax=Ameca splendens TaxID=208324 RepID=A0ABV0Z3R4_9TELE
MQEPAHRSVDMTTDSIWGSDKASLMVNQAQYHHGYLTSFWYLWQCGQVPSPARNDISISIKLVIRSKLEVLQNFLVDGCTLWDSKNIVDQHQQMTWHAYPSSFSGLHSSASSFLGGPW